MVLPKAYNNLFINSKKWGFYIKYIGNLKAKTVVTCGPSSTLNLLWGPFARSLTSGMILSRERAGRWSVLFRGQFLSV